MKNIYHGGEEEVHGVTRRRRKGSVLGRFSFFYDYYDNLPIISLLFFLLPPCPLCPPNSPPW
jgi:hypothetical protein